MKKLIGIFCLIFIVFLTTPSDISAGTGQWYRIEQDGVEFFMQPLDSDNQKLFLLEKTYYLYALSTTNGFLQVQLFDNTNGFVKIVGYVKQDEVKLCEGTPVLPHYPTEILTVGQSNAILKAKPDANAEDISVAFAGQTVNFYGRAWQNSDWYYVKYQNDFGYVQKNQLSVLLVATHPTPIVDDTQQTVTTPQPTTPEETTPQQEETITLEVILILLVCIPAVVIVLLLFMPQKNKKQKYHAPRPKYMSESDTFDDLDLL